MKKGSGSTFFGTIYEWIIGTSPTGINNHLAGLNPNTGIGFIDSPSLYAIVGFWAIAIAIIGYVLFYYLPKSSAVFNLTKHWFITLIIIGIVSFVLAWAMPYNELKKGKYWNVNKATAEGKFVDNNGTEVDKTEAYAYEYTASGETSRPFIKANAKGMVCMIFGFANALFAMFLFGGLSLFKPLRAKSIQSSHVPF